MVEVSRPPLKGPLLPPAPRASKSPTFLEGLPGPRGRPDSQITGFQVRPYILNLILPLGGELRNASSHLDREGSVRGLCGGLCLSDCAAAICATPDYIAQT